MPARTDQLGHRQRLRQRFLERGADGLADYELLELILFQAMPRGDTKPLAKALIDEFGSYAATLRAPPDRIARVKGAGEAVVATIKSVAAAAERLLREEVMDRPVLGSWQALLDYLNVSMAHQMNEQFRVLFLDTRNGLMADEVQQRGTVNHTAAYPREVIRRALELGATALIIVHNHPSGDPSPSRADIEMTRQIRDAAENVGIALHDHVIIARNGHTSFKSMGLL